MHPNNVQIAAFPKENSSRPRTVVITQGADETVVATEAEVNATSDIV